MRLAIFDIDGVLVQRSTERAFWRYLLRRGKQGPHQLIAYAVCLLRYLPFAGIHAAKVNKSYLAGLSCPEVEALGEEFVSQWVQENWVQDAVGRLQDHQQRGDTVALLSGTLELLARPLARHLNVRYVSATQLSQDNGIIQPKLPVVHPFAATKLSTGEKLVRELGFDWQNVTAYGDSFYDLPLLEAAGRAVAVQPDKRLGKIARARGWEILEPGEADHERAREKMTRRA